MTPFFQRKARFAFAGDGGRMKLQPTTSPAGFISGGWLKFPPQCAQVRYAVLGPKNRVLFREIKPRLG